jgi:oxygen-dependent protoporphyrinogen oxidase
MRGSLGGNRDDLEKLKGPRPLAFMSPLSSAPFGSPKKIAVLGGGLTGLTAAYHLSRLGYRVRLFEQTSRVGGAIRTEISDGWLVEAGPNSLQESNAEITALLAELGLERERVEADPAAKNRYLVRDGQLVPLPLSPRALFASPLFSLGAKARILRELSAKPAASADCSIAALVREHFGTEVLERVVQPFVSGVYAGDAEKLSARYAFPKIWDAVRRHGSLLRGQRAAARERRARGEPAIPKLISFQRGLRTLPEALAAQLPAGTLALNARVSAIVPGNPWQVSWSDVRLSHVERFDAVACALPAPALAQLAIGAEGNRPLASLDTIPHPPVSSLFLGFRREDVAHPLDGFGLLVPAIEKRKILGAIFSSALFPRRAPDGHVALTVLFGGALQPQLAALSPAELVAAATEDLRDLLGVRGEPVFQHHSFWRHAIPQYELEYEQHLETIAACERAHAGLCIGGQARDGISLPDCIAAGEKLARRASVADH